MLLDPVFENFLRESPLSVMARAAAEYAFSASALDEVFDEAAEAGYTRDLHFSTVVEMMALVVCGKRPHVQSAHKSMGARVPVTLKSVYEKIQRIEPVVSAAMVRHVAGRCEGLVREVGGRRPALLPGRRARVIDGNHLAATQKRLAPLRGHTAGPRPGQCLAVLDPDLMLVTDLVPCEDAHAQERSLLGGVLPLVQGGDAWVADRNFCTADFLAGIAGRGACFAVRRHANLAVEAEGGYGPEAETPTGWASEREAWVCRGGARLLKVRQVRVRLKAATEDGDPEVEVLTNLPAEEADAAAVAGLYLKRWRIEGAFHELTVALSCEVRTLGYPKAALFAFAVAATAYDVLAVLKGALRAVHGERKVAEEVSGYYVALEWGLVYAGMMIALPAARWAAFGEMPAKELAGLLAGWARRVDLRKIKKAPPRRPTKKKTERIKDKGPHLSTARLLEEATEKKRRCKKAIQRQ